MVDSLVGFESEVGLESESMVGLGYALSVGFVLGMQANSDSTRSITEEYFQPAILQSTEGIFQHYDRRSHSMYTLHEGTPFESA